MSDETLERLVETWLIYSYPQQHVRVSGRRADAVRPGVFRAAVRAAEAVRAQRAERIELRCRPTAMLLNERWCEIFREYRFLLGVSHRRARGGSRSVPSQ